MNNQKIKTITEAMTAKQTWVRKSLDDFLKVWAEITEDDISGHNKFILHTTYQNNEGSKTQIFLRRGVAEIDGDNYNPYSQEWENWGSYMDLNNKKINYVRQLIEEISNGLPKYFKIIQADIDGLSESGMKINALIDKLK